jgi:PAS domain S-box-containing protein
VNDRRDDAGRRGDAPDPARDRLDPLAAGSAFAWTSDGARFTVSGASSELLGRAPASPEDLASLVCEEDRALRAAEIAAAVERGGAWLCTFRSAEDEARWIEERGRASPEGAGGAALAALAFDVTRRKRGEARREELFRRESRARQAAEVATGAAEAAVRALARSEAFLDSIFTAMTDGLVLFDRDGRITRMNPAARDMLRYREEDVARPLEERLARLEVHDVEGRPVPPGAMPVMAALGGAEVRPMPLRVRIPGGHTLWATFGAAPIRGPDGAVVGAVLTLGDVTRLRELQEQREDLSRTIAHDLRTPLNVILAQAKLLGRRAETQDALRQRADAISRSAQHMAALLGDLVESALLEAGKLRLDLAPVDVVALAHDLRRRLAAAYGDRIRVEAPPLLPPVVADAARLERILSNLLTNALKYSAPEREVTLRVADGVEELCIAVEDLGPGIAQEDLPRLFERWFRAAATQRLEGMGLGLYTTRMLVEAHGGHVEVSSEAGKGSVFRVRLPRRRRASPSP